MEDELRALKQAAIRQGRKGFYGPAAVAVNERILEIDPGDAAALLRLALCHTEARKWRAANEAYRRLLQLGVGDALRIQEKLDETWRRAEEEEAAKRRAEERTRESKEEAEERRRQLLEKEREEASTIDSFLDARTLAIALREAGSYDIALIYHERSLELAASKGDRRGALAAHASTLRQARRPGDALVALRQSIELEPSRERNKPSYTSLVATLRELGELDEARREGETLLRLYPDDSWVLFALGRVFKELAWRDRDPALADRARTYYQRASALRPHDRNILAELQSLVEVYDSLAEQLCAPQIAEKARALQRHIARLEPRLFTHFDPDCRAR